MRHPYLAKFAIVAVATFALPVIISRVLQVIGVGTAELLAKTYFLMSPALDPLLKASGILTVSPYLGGIYGILVIFYLQALFSSAGGLRTRLRQNELTNTILGAAKQATRSRWLALLALSVIGTLGISLSPAIPVTGLETLLINCGRLAAFVGLSATALVSAMFSWQHYILSRKARHETIENKLEHPIYLAFTAELIHAIGTNNRIPEPYELEVTLSELRDLASQSHNDQFNHGDLAKLTEQALELFLSGELKTLPDLFSVKKLYHRPDPSALFDIATELQQRIEGTKPEPDAPELLPVPLIKDSDTSLA